MLWRGRDRGDDRGQGDAHQPRAGGEEEGPAGRQARQPPRAAEDAAVRPQEVQRAHHPGGRREGQGKQDGLEPVKSSLIVPKAGQVVSPSAESRSTCLS